MGLLSLWWCTSGPACPPVVAACRVAPVSRRSGRHEPGGPVQAVSALCFHADARSHYVADNSGDIRQGVGLLAGAITRYAPDRLDVTLDDYQIVVPDGVQLFLSNLPFFGSMMPRPYRRRHGRQRRQRLRRAARDWHLVKLPRRAWLDAACRSWWRAACSPWAASYPSRSERARPTSLGVGRRPRLHRLNTLTTAHHALIAEDCDERAAPRATSMQELAALMGAVAVVMVGGMLIRPASLLAFAIVAGRVVLTATPTLLLTRRLRLGTHRHPSTADRPEVRLRSRACAVRSTRGSRRARMPPRAHCRRRRPSSARARPRSAPRCAVRSRRPRGA